MFGFVGKSVEQVFYVNGGEGGELGERVADGPFGKGGAGGNGGGAAFGLEGRFLNGVIDDAGAEAEYVSADWVHHLHLNGGGG